MGLPQRSRLPAPLRIAIIFAIFGILWILLTDHAVELMVGEVDPDTPAGARLQTIKGIAFVLLSSSLVFVLALREHRQKEALAQNEARLEDLVADLEKSRELLGRTERLTSTGSWEYDIGSDRPRWSEGLYTLFGLDPDRPPPGFEAHAELFLSDDFETLRRSVARAIADGTPYDHELRMRRPDGEVRDVFVQGRAVRSPDGGIKRLHGSMVDVTERKRAEKERDLLTTAIEHTADAIIITKADGAIEYVNPAFTDMSGFAREEVLGQNPRFKRSGVQDEAFYRGMWFELAQGRRWSGRLVNARKDGAQYTADLTISPVTNEIGRVTGYVGVERDVSREVELERRLLHALKLDAIGQLAGGVAHDFNNFLTAISGFTTLVHDELPEDSPGRADLAQVLEAADRAAALTRQLLGFARRQAAQPRPLDLGVTIAPMLEMLRRLIGEDIRLTTEVARDLWTVHIDPVQVDQILTNLVVNARDAIADVGTIAISISNETLDNHFCADRVGATPGDHVRLSVADDGRGMDAATRERIFEPFFTTKREGEGTGLGLATVYGIVKQNGGFIEVVSSPGVGSTFAVFLPRAQSASATTATRPAPEPTRGAGTLLVVEDELLLRTLVQRLLADLGYEVIAAHSPLAAIAKAEAHQGPIDLLVTDIVMPEMNGRQLRDTLTGTRPGLRCLYMSGYPSNVLAGRGLIDADIAYLQKPFSQEQLARAVQAALAGPQPG